MSARYPGDTQDALFMEDGPSPAWWTSPDMWLNTPGGTTAGEGANTVHLRLRLAAGKTFTDSQAEVELFAGNPSLVMTPTAGTVNLGTVLVAKTAFPAGGGATDTQIPWTVTVDPGNPGGPDQPGHRCLIARVYPFSSSKPADFQVPTDQHEAQRNICVVLCADEGPAVGGAGGGMAGALGGEPLGPGADGLWAFMFDTTTPLQDRPEQVKLRATRPLRLEVAALERLTPLLERTGFESFAVAPPPRFLLEEQQEKGRGEARGLAVEGVSLLSRVATSLPGAIRDQVTRLPIFGRRPPRFEKDVKLEPKRMRRFALKIDMGKTPRGQAQVVHLEQIGSGRQPVQGGLTLVLLKVS
jgi:hypothetical protein